MGGVDLNDVDLLLEGLEGCLPLSEVLRVEDIVVESFKLAYLVLHTVRDGIDWVTGAGNCFEVVTKNGEEFLEHNAGSVEVAKDKQHVLRSDKDVLDVGKIPSADCDLGLNVHLGLVKLVLPLFEHRDTLLDHCDRFVWWLLENNLQLDVGADLGADLVGDGLENLLEFSVGLVDVTRDRPDQLEAVQE